jgi:hypothetical protein
VPGWLKSEHLKGADWRLSSLVFFVKSSLLISYDFTIVDTNISGISQIVPQNEDAYTYLVEEAHLTTFSDGSAALFDESVADFISDAGWSHFSCELL